MSKGAIAIIKSYTRQSTNLNHVTINLDQVIPRVHNEKRVSNHPIVAASSPRISNIHLRLALHSLTSRRASLLITSCESHPLRKIHMHARWPRHQTKATKRLIQMTKLVLERVEELRK